MVIVPVAIQVRDFENKKIARQMVGSSVLSGMIAIPMAYLGYEIWALVAHTLSASLSYLVILLLNSKWRYSGKFRFSEFKYLFLFSLKMLATTTASFARERFSFLMVGYVYGVVGIGYYSIGYKFLITIRSLIGDPVERITTPALSRVIDNPVKLKEGVRRICMINAIVCIPVFLGIASVSEELVPIVFGDKWMPVIPVLRMLSMSFMFVSLFFYFWPLFVSAGKPDYGIWFHLTHVIFILPLIYVGNHWGMEGVAAGVCLGSFFASIIWLFIVSKKFGLNIWMQLKGMLVPFTSGIFMYVSIFYLKINLTLWKTNMYFILFLSVILGIVSYILSLRILSKNTFDEFRQIALKVMSRKGEII
jgi:PST family polysaccharide transporter